MYATNVIILVLVYHCLNYLERSISNEGDYERHALLEKLTVMDKEDSYNLLHMGNDTFTRLITILQGMSHLRNSEHNNVKKQVVEFLYVISHSLKNITMKFYFRCSTETINRHFHQVLKTIIFLDNVFLK